MTYTVPARLVLTVVHQRDPEREPIRRVAGQPQWGRHGPDPRLGQRDPVRVAEYTADSDDGATLCGLPMLIDEQWIDWTPAPDERLCPHCIAGEPDQQETLL